MSNLRAILLWGVATIPTVSQAQEETWIKMFKGMNNPYYSSSGVTSKDTWMFSAGCVAYSTFVKRDRLMSEYFVGAMTGMEDEVVDGWSRMSDSKKNDFYVKSVQYARSRIEKEIGKNLTTWRRVGYLCAQIQDE